MVIDDFFDILIIFNYFLSKRSFLQSETDYKINISISNKYYSVDDHIFMFRRSVVDYVF